MTETEASSPEFEHWGNEIAEPAPEGAATRRARPRLTLRLGAVALAVIGLIVLIAALSSGGGGSAPRPSGTATPAEVAAQINLRVADVPAYHRGPAAGMTVGADPNGAIAACMAGNGPALLTATPIASPVFGSGTGLHFTSIESTVALSTPAVVAQEIQAAATPAFANCAANALAALSYRVHGLAITGGGGAQATPLPLPASHSAVVHTILAQRASMNWSVSGISLPVFVDAYEVAVGRDVLSLFALSSQQPLSIPTESALISRLERRTLARTH